MTSSKMFVPDKIKVGYQNRSDTYTKKLAYVIYFDNKGTLRKEKSWEGWRDKKIDPQEFTNEPIEGFVLNKGVGGSRCSYGWNARNEYIRVYDPRDFEFEISVANLLFILQECSAIKGKGLEGEFVYAWDGTELVLLPVSSAEYQECKDHTARQSKKISAKDIKPGFSYITKTGINVLYLGKYPYNNNDYNYSPVGNRHIFLNLDNPNPKYGSPYIVDTGFTKLAEQISSNPLTNFPDELDRFKVSRYYGEIIEFEMTPVELLDDSTVKNINSFYGYYVVGCDNGLYYNAYIRQAYYKEPHYRVSRSAEFKPEIKNNKIIVPKNYIYNTTISLQDLKQLKIYKLHGITPAGTKIQIG